MTEFYIAYIFIIILALLLTGSCYYFYNKFNLLESDFNFLKLNSTEEHNTPGDNLSDYCISELSTGDSTHHQQEWDEDKLTQELYSILKNNQGALDELVCDDHISSTSETRQLEPIEEEPVASAAVAEVEAAAVKGKGGKKTKK